MLLSSRSFHLKVNEPFEDAAWPDLFYPEAMQHKVDAAKHVNLDVAVSIHPNIDGTTRPRRSKKCSS